MASAILRLVRSYKWWFVILLLLVTGTVFITSLGGMAV
jgi:hypothetical protein